MVAQSYRWAEVYIHPPTLSVNASNLLRTNNMGMLEKGAKIKGSLGMIENVNTEMEREVQGNEVSPWVRRTR